MMPLHYVRHEHQALLLCVTANRKQQRSAIAVPTCGFASENSAPTGGGANAAARRRARRVRLRWVGEAAAGAI